ADHPRVSPVGSRVAFVTFTSPEKPPIWRVCNLPSCTNPIDIPRPNAKIFPPFQWTPDGAGIAYVPEDKPANIWVQPLAGGEPHQLTHFTDHEITGFAWSPDGKKLAIARATTFSDIVLLKGLK